MGAGPLFMTSLALQGVGAGIQAKSTLAGGDYAYQAGVMQKQAADFKADQLEQNAVQAFASGQRKALEARRKGRLAISSNIARAAASGVDAGSGSPALNAEHLAARSEEQALTEMFSGASEASGLRHQALGARMSGDLALMEGEEKRRASRLQAAGTLAGGVGGIARSLGGFLYPRAA